MGVLTTNQNRTREKRLLTSTTAYFVTKLFTGSIPNFERMQLRKQTYQHLQSSKLQKDRFSWFSAVLSLRMRTVLRDLAGNLKFVDLCSYMYNLPTFVIYSLCLHKFIIFYKLTKQLYTKLYVIDFFYFTPIRFGFCGSALNVVWD